MRPISTVSGLNMYPDRVGYRHNVVQTDNAKSEGQVMPQNMLGKEGMERVGLRIPF